MLISKILLGLTGFAGGIAIAAGTFAFINTLGLIPRMIGKSKTANEIIRYENTIILGGTIGNILWILWVNSDIRIPFGSVFLGISGFCYGVFVGGLAAALAEALKTFPILFRRLKLKTGLSIIVLCFALGKTAGSLWYFYHRMADV